MSSQTYQYGPPADLTGPCLITVSYDSTASTSVTSMVQMCTAGSLTFDNPISHISEKCSYLMVDTTQQVKQTCRIAPLSGELSGSGDIRTLIDASSTVTLTATTIYIGTDSAAYLPVPRTSVLSHFISAGAAEVSGQGTGATTSAGTAGTIKTSSTGVSTKTTSAGTAAATAATSARTTSVASAAGVTGGSSTSTGAAAATTSAKSGQSKLHSSKVGMLAVFGSLVWALCAY